MSVEGTGRVPETIEVRKDLASDCLSGEEEMWEPGPQLPDAGA